jgi:hypothetical protein
LLGQVTEATFAHRARAAGCPTQVPISKKKPDLRETTFKERIAWMIQQGPRTPAEPTSWEGRRQWRNYRSHRDGQDITPPTMAAPMLKRIAADINALFRPAMAPRHRWCNGHYPRAHHAPCLPRAGEGR